MTQKNPFAQIQIELKQAIDHDLPIIIGNEAVSMFKKNFHQEGFFGKPWQRSKRIGKAKGADGVRKTLTGRTGDLGRSIKMKPAPGKVTIYSDVPYAAVHNEGLRAGRGKGFTMPRRQFMGDSPELHRVLREKIEKHLNKILHK